MNKNSFVSIIFTIIGSTLLLNGNAVASRITLTHAGTGSGVIGATSFYNADFVITALADTSNATHYTWLSTLQHDSVSIDIDGVGVFTFIDGTRTFVRHDLWIVGFKRDVFGDLFDGPGDAAFSTWDFTTSIAPITGTGDLLQWNQESFPPIQTTGGELYFLDENDVPATFQATVVPVPAAVWLFVSGLLGFTTFVSQTTRRKGIGE